MDLLGQSNVSAFYYAVLVVRKWQKETNYKCQFFPALESFPMSQFFATGGQSTGASASASVLPVSIQG